MMVSRWRWHALRLLLLFSIASVSRAAADPTEPDTDSVTFCKHIAPILWEHCIDCHRPGEVGAVFVADLSRRHQTGHVSQADHARAADAPLEARAGSAGLSRRAATFGGRAGADFSLGRRQACPRVIGPICPPAPSILPAGNWASRTWCCKCTSRFPFRPTAATSIAAS